MPGQAACLETRDVAVPVIARARTENADRAEMRDNMMSTRSLY